MKKRNRKSRLDASKCENIVRRFKKQKAKNLEKIEEAIASDDTLKGNSDQIMFRKERAVRKRTAPLCA